MARATFVKKARKDIKEGGKVIIKKGESYYWWQFRNCGKSYSKTPPKASQLTRSAYLSRLYDLQERIGSIRDRVNDASDLESEVDAIKTELEEMKDECDSSLQNMPDHLQESSILNERIESLDNAISEFENIDYDYDEPSDEELRDDAMEELDLSEDDAEEKANEIDAKVVDLRDDKLSEWLDKKCDEITGIDIG